MAINLAKAETEGLRAAAEAQSRLAELEKITARNSAIIKVSAAVAGTIGTIYVAKKIYDWTRSTTLDNRVQQELAKSQIETRDQSARRVLDFMKTESEFKTCIVDHARGPRRADGLPVECSKSANEYVKHIGVERLSQVNASYQKMFGDK